jgi:DNA primase
MTQPSYIDLGRKSIKNEGSRYPNFSLQEYLNDQGVRFKARDSNDHIEYSTNCPKCVERGEERPDTKGRLWVNPMKGTFVCYNCRWDGPLVRLIQHYSHASYESALGILRGKAGSLDHLNFTLHQRVFENEDDTESEITTVTLPHEFRDFRKRSPQSVFTEYLKHRGIPLDYAIDHSWGYAESGYTRNRIIVPTYINETLVFWQARDVLEEAHPKWGTSDYRKVLNPKGVSANKVLYNYDDAKDFREIVICEGFIDAVKVGDNAVATNGKTLHPAQME